MRSIYHIVSRKPSGNRLYPLAQIKDIDPNLYADMMSKYQGRERVLAMVIPQLGCRWDEVLHMAAVHPHEVAGGLAEAGLQHNFLYYEIDPATLDQAKLIVYPNIDREGNRIYHLKPEDFTTFDPSELDKWAHVPRETIDYYKKNTIEGKKVLTFRHIPHILYKGSVDITNLELKRVTS